MGARRTRRYTAARASLSLHGLYRSFLKIWGQSLGRSLVLHSSAGFSRALLGRALHHFPSGLFHRGSGGVIAVNNIAVCDAGDHGCDRPDIIIVPRTQQAAANQIVDVALVSG